MSFVIDLTGRAALVTGASSGLGYHFARALARAGAAVAVTARRRESLGKICEEIAAAGRTAVPIALDVTDTATIPKAVEAAADQLGGLDILVNNAGTTDIKPLTAVSEDDWDRVIDTNLKGAFLVAQAAARRMQAAARGGAIVNIASILGLRVAGEVGPYVVSKAGLVQLTKVMALELARDRIRVNALCPGYVETDINRDFFASEAGKALIRRIPQRRLGTPDELEGPLLLLCSEAASYLTGAVLAVDGGHLVSSL